MYNLNKKQKIIIGILIFIVAIGIYYYVYVKDNNTEIQTGLENNFEIQEKNETEEEYSDDTILVHVSGAVNKECVIELKINSRISDAIDKAGGFREDAYTKDINLAYKLEDGMKIYIPTKDEKLKSDQASNETINNEVDLTEKYVTTSSGTLTNNNTDKKESKININTATQSQLETLPGIGATTALKIIDYRNTNGKFNKIEDIKEVSGIGEAKFEKIKEYINVK